MSKPFAAKDDLIASFGEMHVWVAMSQRQPYFCHAGLTYAQAKKREAEREHCWIVLDFDTLAFMEWEEAHGMQEEPGDGEPDFSAPPAPTGSEEEWNHPFGRD